ncbi:class I SAM-dependent methyltransferase [Blastococcus sp. TF02A-35]|uniref:SAM-dependent methyltransferase n=1 Tax=Blastococcus sp. TF02A-35 TaxID=2559612 RepID=UPI001073410F|nr:class I SAM-dependent methyltransferase [Blastococcus sp. TF02A_35]TFV50344.1 class I SAM-dependent methyltransferase [Blastococcus sp. TF02A_35]
MSATDRESYEELYRSAPSVWSGRPNRQLVVEAADLAPGTALDAGCGEGADALWLAQRGWRVTGVDFSAVALERAAAQAREQGLDERVEWVQADLDEWTPATHFDLVTAHYLHARGASRAELFQRLAATVAPGGTLLVVGHLMDAGPAHDHQPPGEHGHGDGHGHGQQGHRHDPEAMYTAEEVAAVLDPAEWDSVLTETRSRDPKAVERTGNATPDTVLVARRRA